MVRLAANSLISIIQATNPSKALPVGERMNNVQLSIDKVAIEYHGVTVNFYNQIACLFGTGLMLSLSFVIKVMFTIGI